VITLWGVSASPVGRVTALYRYPVKSMAPEPLDSVEVSWHGLAGDRRWAFIRDGQVRSDFPWLTARERADLLHHEPSFTSPESPDSSPTIVRTPGGTEYDVTDPALAALFGDGVRLIKQNRGVFDTMPLSLITTQTIGALTRLAGRDLDVQRFRPNLVVDVGVDADFPEDTWVGSVIAAGGLRMRVDQRDERCVMVNIDPVTTERDARVLRTIARQRSACLGVYGTTVQPGTVAVGDLVTIASA
jgi:uncharacterized protein YcbX